MFSKTKLSNQQYLFFFIILLSFSQIFSQKIEEIKIGQPITDRMEIDESHKYFKLVLPESIRGKILQITTKQNKDLVTLMSTYQK